MEYSCAIKRNLIGFMGLSVFSFLFPSSLSLSFGRNTHPRVASFFFIPVGLRAWLCGLLPMLRCGDGVVGSIRLSFSIWVQISAVVYNSGLGFRFLVFLFLSLGCA